MSSVMTRLVRLKSTVFCGLLIGINAVTGAALASTASSSFQAKLHVPWTLLQTRAQSAIEGEALSRDLPDRVVNAAGLDWHLQGIRVDAKTPQAVAKLESAKADFTFPQFATTISIQKVYVDQVVTREINGVTINIHFQGSCGPLSLRQDAAQGGLHFAIDWTTGSPVVGLTQLDLAWPSGSWSSPEVTCEGPAGMGEALRTEILNQLKDAEAFKPLMSSVLQDGVQPQLQAILEQVRQPITASTGKGKVEFQIGALEAATTGILANIESGTEAKALPVDAAMLNALPQDRPVLLGGLDMLENVVAQELAARDRYFTLDLQKVPTFHSLMKSRFLQFFVWKDLMKYPKSSPFYLRIHNPGALTLKHAKTTSAIETTFPLNAVMQSYRVSTWWSYVTVQGTAKASISLGLTDGKLTYKTTTSEPSVAVNYGADYVARFGKPGSIPKSRIISSLDGPQADLSGEMTFDDIAIDSVGKYRASTFKWLSPKVFAITWSQTK